MVSHLAAFFTEESPVLQAFWGFLVVNNVKGLALFVVAWATLKVCRGLSSELRHLVWLLVIVSSLVFPAVWLLTPAVQLGVPVAMGRSTTPLVAAVPFAARGQLLEILTVPGTEGVVADHRVTLLRRLLPIAAGGLWLAGALFFLQRLAVGRLLASRLLKRARPAQNAPGLLGELSRRLGIRQTVTVGLSPECGIPFTFGILRPVVLLPEAARAWPPQRLRSVLLHELTHIRRRECLVNSIAATICSLLWFLPVLWLAYSSMRREAEKSSDRSVLRHGIRGTEYASDLIELVHNTTGLVLAAGTAIPLGRRRFLRERIRSVLSSRREGLNPHLWMARVVLALVFCCLVTLLAASGASVAGERPLTGSWDNPEGPALFQRTWTADGRTFIYYGKGATTPSLVGRYTIEKKWTDAEGSRWYHAVERRSPPPYREGISCTRYCVIRIDPTGTRLECCASPYGYSGMLTLGDYPVFYQEKQVFYRQAPRKL